jgi:NDP-sugar pyrophosphorylase family protein
MRSLHTRPKQALKGSWSKADDITAIIPAAGRVAEGLLPMAGRLSSAMVPVGGKPVIYWTIDYLARLGVTKFIIAVRERGQFLEDFVRASFPDLKDIHWVCPDVDGGPGYTVALCAEHVTTERVLVVLGDTFFHFDQNWIKGSTSSQVHSLSNNELPEQSFILTAPVKDCYRWCMVEASHGQSKTFTDKPASCEPSTQAAIGVYAFDDVELLKLCGEETISRVNATKGHSETSAQISELLKRYIQIAPIAVRAPGEWLDCGNSDNLARSHQRLLQQRAFNEISIDSQIGVFSKTSSHEQKFTDEINYYKLLPPKLSVLFPRVVESSVERDKQYLSLEYYGYPTLAELWLYENLHPSIWEQILSHLHQIIVGPMAEFKREVPAEDYSYMYVEKTLKRTSSIDPESPLGRLVYASGGIRVNGVACPSLDSVMALIKSVLPDMINDGRQGVIHGDMCFSNVLYDLRSRICKFIDPRGSFGEAGIFGDQKYDVAKLFHSVVGLYDFIVNDLFSLRVSNTNVTLEVHSRGEHKRAQEVFSSVFFGDFDRRHIQLITGLLFISMPALHYDVPQRQLAMYSTGMHLIALSEKEHFRTIRSTVLQMSSGGRKSQLRRTERPAIRDGVESSVGKQTIALT